MNTVAGPASLPRSSVIVCVHNRSRQIVDCVASLVAMRDCSFEIVLVDDASTDDTHHVLEILLRAHPEFSINIVRNAENLGVSGARNVGIDVARGRFVCFLDSDCVAHPDWLSELTAPLENASISASAGAVVEPPPRNLAERAFFGDWRIGQAAVQGRPLVGCNMAFRRDVLEQHRFDPQLRYSCDEDDLGLRIRAAGHRFAFAPKAIVEHRHLLDLVGYFSTAWRRGEGSGRYWWKHGIVLGRDVGLWLPILVLLAASAIEPRASLVACALIGLHSVLHLGNEVAFKGKSVSTALVILPLVVLASLIKFLSAVRTIAVLAIGRRPLEPVSAHHREGIKA